MLESDPIDLLFDADGDLAIGPDGGFQFASGLAGVAQAVRVRLLMFREEWFLNLDAGVPWYQEILGEKVDDSLLRQRIIEAVAATPGVVEILTLTIARDTATRRIAITIAVRTVFGDTEPDTLTIGGS